MVTASHNPPQDNGYKVYLGDGSQIVPPADAEIAARIDAVGHALPTIPRGDPGARARRDRSWTATSTSSPASPATARATSTSSTPRCTASAARRWCRCSRPPGSPRRAWSPSRQQPDPDFPTVAFPNPEEPGRDGPGAGARRRPAAPTWWSPTTPTPTAARSRCPGPHGWRMLRGDEVGALLAHALLARGAEGVYATTIVSSTLLVEDGRRRRAAVRRDADRLQVDRAGRGARLRLRGGARLLRGPRARARQGRRLRAAAAVRARGAASRPRAARSPTCSTTWPATHGLHATDQLSVRVDRPRRDRRGDGPPAQHPADDPGRPGRGGVDDLDLGSEPTCPPTDGLRYRLADGARVVVRPSGTEPKLKCYLEVVVPVEAVDAGGGTDAVDAARIERRRAPRRAARRHPGGRRDLSWPLRPISAMHEADDRRDQQHDLGPGRLTAHLAAERDLLGGARRIASQPSAASAARCRIRCSTMSGYDEGTALAVSRSVSRRPLIAWRRLRPTAGEM